MKNDIFGGLFDFNGDGKTDIFEEFIAFKMFEECTKDDSAEAEPLETDAFGLLFDITEDEE